MRGTHPDQNHPDKQCRHDSGDAIQDDHGQALARRRLLARARCRRRARWRRLGLPGRIPRGECGDKECPRRHIFADERLIDNCGAAHTR